MTETRYLEITNMMTKSYQTSMTEMNRELDLIVYISNQYPDVLAQFDRNNLKLGNVLDALVKLNRPVPANLIPFGLDIYEYIDYHFEDMTRQQPVTDVTGPGWVRID